MTTALPLSGLRVLEYADNPGGEMLGKLLVEVGADVVKVEPPGGAASRNIGPFKGGKPDVNASLAFWFYNRGKRSIVLDLQEPSGQVRMQDVMHDFDLLICTLPALALRELGWSYAQLCEANPRLIVVSITPFGLTGPWADWISSDLIALALGGPLNSCGYDDHSIPPIRPGGDNGFQPAASFGQIATVAALIEREMTGRGQLVDIAVHDCLAVTPELANPYWFYPRSIVQRQTCRHAQPVPTQPTLFECMDGRYVTCSFVLSDPVHWRALTGILQSRDLAVDLLEEKYLTLKVRQENFPHIQSIIETYFLLTPALEAAEECQRFGLPVGPINAPEDLLEDDHLKSRRFFVSVPQSDGSEPFFPTSAFRFDESLPPITQRAPNLGEHTAEVLTAS